MEKKMYNSEIFLFIKIISEIVISDGEKDDYEYNYSLCLLNIIYLYIYEEHLTSFESIEKIRDFFENNEISSDLLFKIDNTFIIEKSDKIKEIYLKNSLHNELNNEEKWIELNMQRISFYLNNLKIKYLNKTNREIYLYLDSKVNILNMIDNSFEIFKQAKYFKYKGIKKFIYRQECDDAFQKVLKKYEEYLFYEKNIIKYTSRQELEIYNVTYKSVLEKLLNKEKL